MMTREDSFSSLPNYAYVSLLATQDNVVRIYLQSSHLHPHDSSPVTLSLIAIGNKTRWVAQIDLLVAIFQCVRQCIICGDCIFLAAKKNRERAHNILAGDL